MYRVSDFNNQTVELVSNDEIDLKLGFRTYAPGVYVKTVSRSEVQSLYSATPKASYLGHTFTIVREQDGVLLLAASYAAPEWGFTHAEPGVWEKWVPRAEVERVWEERTPY